MLKLISKPGCRYCEVFKDYLDEAEINYETVKPSRGRAVPTLMLDQQVIFEGLPHVADLVNFIIAYKNEEV